MSDSVRSEERDKAEFESRHCGICDGAGQMIVFHHLWTGGRFVKVTTERNGEIIESQIPAEVSGHCICAIGRWMRSKTTEALKARIPDGAAIVEGRSNWCFQRPGEPTDQRYEAPTRDAIARTFGKIPSAF